MGVVVVEECVARVDVIAPGLGTEAGVGVGGIRSLAAYRGRAEVQPHPYTVAGGHDSEGWIEGYLYAVSPTAAESTSVEPRRHCGSELSADPKKKAQGAPMHRSRLGNIVIDCQSDDLWSEAQFWSTALGYRLPTDPDASGGFIQLATPPGDVQIIIQRVRHDARAHLDIETDSMDSEVARLEHLGATVISRNDGWVVMQAPSGHGFCVGSPYRGGFDQGANVWE